jgi:hypothetical protein
MLLAVGLVLPGRYVDVRVLLVEEAPGVKGDVALAHGALDARARLLLLTDHALEGATRRGHAGVVNQLQLVGLSESDVGEPKRALYMGPVPRGGGLQGTPPVPAEGAADLVTVHTVLTEPAKPLPHGNGFYTITALMHAQIAVVAEYDLVLDLAVALPAHRAEDVLRER